MAVMTMITLQVYLILSCLLCKQNEGQPSISHHAEKKLTFKQLSMILSFFHLVSKYNKTSQRKRLQFWFCLLCMSYIVSVSYEALWCFQATRANLLCAIPGTPYTLISSPLTWSTCLQSLHTNPIPVFPGKTLSMATKNIVKVLTFC